MLALEGLGNDSAGGKDYITRGFMICDRHILFGDTIKKNEIGGASSTYGGQKGALRVLVGKPERHRQP